MALCQQLFLCSVLPLEAGLVWMNCYTSGRISIILLMMGAAQRKHKAMAAGLCAPVDMVDADHRLMDLVHVAGDAAERG